MTAEEANDCWDYDLVNDTSGYIIPPEVALKQIISDNELSLEQKVYLTWIYAYTLEKRKEFDDNQVKAW